MLHHPFDRDFGIQAARLRQGGLRLVHLARMRVGGRRTQICRVPSLPGPACFKAFALRSSRARRRGRLDPLAVRLDWIEVAVAIDRRIRVDGHDDRPVVGTHRIAEVEDFRRDRLAADREGLAHFVKRIGSRRGGRSANAFSLSPLSRA